VRDVQYDINVSGFYDLVWEISVILVQPKGLGQIQRLDEVFGIG